MNTVIIGRSPRRRPRSRMRNPREGIVPKPGIGGMITIAIVGVLGFVLAGMIVFFGSVLDQETFLDRMDRPSMVEDSSLSANARLRATVRMVDACPSLRPMARAMIADRDLSEAEFGILSSRAAGCPSSTK